MFLATYPDTEVDVYFKKKKKKCKSPPNGVMFDGYFSSDQSMVSRVGEHTRSVSPSVLSRLSDPKMSRRTQMWPSNTCAPPHELQPSAPFTTSLCKTAQNRSRARDRRTSTCKTHTVLFCLRILGRTNSHLNAKQGQQAPEEQLFSAS